MMIIAITQARMSSSRLPGKVLKPILGHPMIWHQLQRTLQAQQINKSIVATSNDSSDDVLADYLLSINQPVYRGSLNNVLSRYYECAKKYKAKHILRLTADCPMTDPSIIDELITQHLKQGNDYTHTEYFPLGISVELCTFEVLEAAYLEANKQSQREHVTLFIYQQPKRFKIGALRYKEDLSRLRWTVDYPEDFAFATQVYEALYPKNPHFTMQDVLGLLNEVPALGTINAHCIQNQVVLSPSSEEKTMTYLDE